MTDLPDTSPNLGLPFYQTKLNEFEVQHNEALLMLDALVMLAVKDRDLSAPPGSPALGDRYLVKPAGTGAFAGKDNRIAQYDTGGWNFYQPQAGWTCYVQDEQTLLAWDGESWEPALDVLGGITELQELSLLGVGTTADSTNPLSAKLNNALWAAKTVAEGGDGDLRYKLSKESAAKTLSLLFQDNYSGRAEIGLAGDDDFHFKVSADGSSWVDALVLDKITGAAKLNSAVALTGDLSPSQITSDQNDYNPAGLSGASVLRLSTNASRNLTGLAGGAGGRVAAIVNVGSNNLVLKDASTASSAANRFSFGADVTLASKQSAVLWYDANDGFWKLLAGPQAAAAGSVAADLELTVAELAMGLADALNVAQFLGGSGNRFADSFDALTYVNTGGATNLDSGTAGLLKPTASSGASPSYANAGGTGSRTGSITVTSSAGNDTGLPSAMVNGVSGSNNGTDAWDPAAASMNDGAYVLFDFGSGASKAISEIKLYANQAVNGNFKFQGSPNNSTWTDGASFTWNAIGAQTVSVALTSAGYRYFRLLKVGSESDQNRWWQEIEFKIDNYSAAGTNNLTVASTGLSAAAAPSSMRVVALVKHVDSATPGTDYKFKVSRDGGAHLSGYLTLNNRFTIPGGSVRVIESDAIDVSGITSGTTPLWQFETLNNKMVELQGVYLYWT